MDIKSLSKRPLTSSELSEKLEKRNLSWCFFCSDILPIEQLIEVSMENVGILKCCKKCYDKRFKFWEERK